MTDDVGSWTVQPLVENNLNVQEFIPPPNTNLPISKKLQISSVAKFRADFCGGKSPSPIVVYPLSPGNKDCRAIDNALVLCQVVRDSGLYNFESCKIPLRTNLNIPFFRFMLSDYEDKQVCDFLDYGFPIGYLGKIEIGATKIKNHKGATEFPNEVRSYLEKEMAYGAVLGPLQTIPFDEEFRISPLNTVDKKD